MGKQQIRAQIDIDTYSPINQRLADFKTHLDRLAESIGADSETANVLIEYESDPYDSRGYFNAYVWRYETDEECAERERREAAQKELRNKEAAARRDAEERRAYEYLKAKYEAQ